MAAQRQYATTGAFGTALDARLNERARRDGVDLHRVGRRIKKLLDLLLDDEIDMDEGKAEMKALDSRRRELDVQLKVADEPPPLLHPSMADLYRSKVEELASAL